MPGGDIGLAVIVLTLIVKLILAPLTRKSIKSQAKLKSLEPEIKKIKEQYKNKEEQAKKTFALYKIHKINPFSGCLLILIQLPIIFALYFVFLKGLSFSEGTLYSFITVPREVSTHFLGLIDIQGKSLILALLAGISQFFQTRLAMHKYKQESKKGEESFKDNLMKSLNLNMKYFMPVFVAVIAYQISAAVALYWITSNIFIIGQELLIRRRAKQETETRDVLSEK